MEHPSSAQYIFHCRLFVLPNCSLLGMMPGQFPWDPAMPPPMEMMEGFPPRGDHRGSRSRSRSSSYSRSRSRSRSSSYEDRRSKRRDKRHRRHSRYLYILLLEWEECVLILVDIVFVLISLK